MSPESDLHPPENPSVPSAAPALNEVSAPSGSVVSTPTLFVSDLDFTVTESILFEIFNLIGPVARYVRGC